MARKLCAGNWKMNGTGPALEELRAMAAGLDALGREAPETLICPPATLLHRAATIATDTALRVGAQDCHAAESGAHTGDLSAAMLAEAGAAYVIVGHSERRQDHGEDDAQVRAKAEAAQAAGLTPIVCVGETLAQREAGEALPVIAAQVAGSLPRDGALVLAYEPVWAIGTGKVAGPAEIAEVHEALRRQLTELLGEEAAARVPLLYGGSVKAGNAAEIFAVPEVDGALVGGASLKAADFMPIVEALGQA